VDAFLSLSGAFRDEDFKRKLKQTPMEVNNRFGSARFQPLPLLTPSSFCFSEMDIRVTAEHVKNKYANSGKGSATRTL
jgi:hypothetical protein